MLCSVCEGVGHFIELIDNKITWFDCSMCEGEGVRHRGGPAEIKLGKTQSGFCRPLKEPAKTKNDD